MSVYIYVNDANGLRTYLTMAMTLWELQHVRGVAVLYFILHFEEVYIIYKGKATCFKFTPGGKSCSYAIVHAS